jgi:hypothetical protein
VIKVYSARPPEPIRRGRYDQGQSRAEIVDGQGDVVATFNETCHHYGVTVVTVRLRAPVTLQGTELLAIYAKGIAQSVISVEASDPAGTEIREFHGRCEIGCVSDGTEIALVKSPGGDLGTLLIVLGAGTVSSR